MSKLFMSINYTNNVVVSGGAHTRSRTAAYHNVIRVTPEKAIRTRPVYRLSASLGVCVCVFVDCSKYFISDLIAFYIIFISLRCISVDTS